MNIWYLLYIICLYVLHNYFYGLYLYTTHVHSIHQVALFENFSENSMSLDARQVGCERHQGALGDSKLIIKCTSEASWYFCRKVIKQVLTDDWHLKAIKERKFLRNHHWNSLVSCFPFQMWNKDFARYGYGTRCCNVVRAVRSMREKEKFKAVRE